jgi:hypothetical protein
VSLDSNVDRATIPDVLFHHMVFNMVADYAEWEIPIPEFFPAFLIGGVTNPEGVPEVWSTPASFRDHDGVISGEKLLDSLRPNVRRFRPAAALVISDSVAGDGVQGKAGPAVYIFFIRGKDVEVLYRNVIKDGERWNLGPRDWRPIDLSSTLEAMVAPILSEIRAS